MNKTTKKTIEMKKAIGFSRYSVDVVNAKVYDEEKERWLLTNPNKVGYVYVNVFNDTGVKETMGLHRFIYMAATGESIPEGYEVDHINKDSTENGMCNLELVTKEENRRRRNLKDANFKRINAEKEKWLKEQFESMNFYHGSKMDKFGILASELNVSIRAIQYRYKSFNESEMLA